ncbi:hypothetical protein Ahy_A04g018135 isoform C [Arachis hypogaea]|uniref:C-JID domain-containing protein n=1 Tax=Arachis hypogaea TaxID=3818 RepID=A0A445DCY1_ARAHY|nr:hypothetical protein Ahy_A04g018135 isoform C [Arachis hypogaea]
MTQTTSATTLTVKIDLIDKEAEARFRVYQANRLQRWFSAAAAAAWSSGDAEARSEASLSGGSSDGSDEDGAGDTSGDGERRLDKSWSSLPHGYVSSASSMDGGDASSLQRWQRRGQLQQRRRRLLLTSGEPSVATSTDDGEPGFTDDVVRSLLFVGDDNGTVAAQATFPFHWRPSPSQISFFFCSDFFLGIGLESLTAWDDSDNPNIVGLLGSLSRLTSLSSLKLEGCFETSREEPTLYYDLGHLESLTDLDLSDNYFLKVPISIYKLPRLTRLNLDYCCYLKVLPELPSSLRELRARGCDSLVASNVNDVVSKACYGFAESSSQDREDVLQMLIHGKEIPAWFEHQEQDNGVSVSFPLNCPAPESIALSLCFLLQGKAFLSKQPSVICNGKEFINTSLLNVWSSSYNLCIVCVNSYYFSNLLCQHNHFQMLFPSDYNIRVQRSGARWVCKQNIQDFKKGKSEIGKRKRNS